MRKYSLFYAAMLGMAAMAQTPQVTGDVTGDGQVDIADVNAVVNAMLGMAAMAQTPQVMGDVTGGGQVDIADVNAVITTMLGQ